MKIRRKTVQKGRRIAAACMAAATFSVSICVPAKAAAPRVQVDETMYVNTDYYGKETQINVVKGCSTNGVTQYTDYGVYDKVVNMSDKTEPVIGDGTVTWQFPEENKRFYYQCTMPEGSVTMPWSFDVTYKLNGVETDAAKLAGASGLVEIHIKADPNDQAKAYFKNNMMLSVVVPVDMAKCYSVDAPGSQLQAVGNNTVAVFAALPGEEGDYTVRIGTDSFESTGVIMMMVPGTVDALNHIKDLKEAKDTWREDGNQMYDSMNELLKTMESMKLDVTKIKGGLGSLDNAREQVNGNRKQIETLSTQAVADLQSVTEQTAEVIPYLDTAQKAVSDINDNVNAIYNTLEDTQDELDKLYDRLNSLRKSLESSSGRIRQGISLTEQQAIASEIQQQTQEIEQILGALGQLLESGQGAYSLTEEDLEELEKSLESADAFRYDRRSKKAGKASSGGGAARATDSDAEEESITAFGEEAEALSKLLRRGPSGLPGTGGVNEEDFEEWSDEELDEYADKAEEKLQALLGTAYPDSVEDLLEQLQGILGDGETVQKTAGEVIARINGICSDIGNVGSKTASTLNALRGATDELINLIDDSRVLIDTMNGYVPSMIDALGATEELMNRLTGAMGSTHDLLALVNSTAIAAGDSLDAGTRDSLNGMMSVLDKALKMLDDTTAVRKAGESMKGTLDEQLDKFEDENNFLNMDPEADMVSFTSGKNQSPHSLQIIVRTDEISTDDGATPITDMEDADSEDVSPFTRMWRVIVKIFESIIDIFRNR